MDLTQKVFEGKTVEDLVKEVYNKHKEQETKLNEEIARISRMITNPGDAIVLVPLLKGFFNSSLQNDQTIMKLVQIFQRASEARLKETGGESGMLTEQDIQQLFDEVQSLDTTVKKLPQR